MYMLVSFPIERQHLFAVKTRQFLLLRWIKFKSKINYAWCWHSSKMYLIQANDFVVQRCKTLTQRSGASTIWQSPERFGVFWIRILSWACNEKIDTHAKPHREYSFHVASMIVVILSAVSFHRSPWKVPKSYQAPCSRRTMCAQISLTVTQWFVQ